MEKDLKKFPQLNLSFTLITFAASSRNTEKLQRDWILSDNNEATKRK